MDHAVADGIDRPGTVYEVIELIGQMLVGGPEILARSQVVVPLHHA